MKLSLFLVSFAATASGFSPLTLKARASTALQTAFPQRPLNDWSNKPAYERKSTEPVAKNKVTRREREKMEDVMIDPDYFLAVATALLCPLIIWYHPSYFEDGSPSLIGVSGGLFHFLFATLLWVQTRRVRCVFEKDAFEFYNIKGRGLDLNKEGYLQEKPANYVSGTRNRWKYDSITNWGFFPSEVFPVICYFKETETPEWKWDRWFAAFDSYGRGQPHFFPGICNIHQFKREMEKRGVKQKPIPKFADIKNQM